MRWFRVLPLLTIAACAPHEPPTPPPHRITQVSVIDALMAGRYDGVMPIGELLRLGDFGLGTLDHLDGELVILDGRPYQIRADGGVFDVPPERTTPFAIVAPFVAETDTACPAVDGLATLDDHLNQAFPRKNRFAAFRIDGRFARLTMRSVGRQEPPYRPLDEVAREQSVWTREDLSGTLVGVRSPAWAGGLTVPGYHWHFLAEDRKSGGHVLDLQILEGRLRVDVISDWEIKLEPAAAFDDVDLAKDRSQELKRVESARGADADHP